MFDKLKRGFSEDRNNLAVFIDGPNIIRKEFDIDLDKLRERLEDMGELKIAKVFLNQHASNKLIEAIMSQGFDPDLGLGDEKERDSDVDVYMAVSTIEAVYNEAIDTIVIVTRDADFLPVIQKAKEMGKKTIVVGVDQGFSTALKNVADDTIILK